jgi:hypothetical protein
MTHDQIDRMVRQANPVPDLTALEPVDASVLVLDQQRRTEMQTHDRIIVDQVQEKPRRGVLIGIAAAAAIAVGVLILFQPGEEAPVADEPATASPVEIATAFVEAYAAFDMDEAFSYLAADANLSQLGGKEQMRRWNRLSEAQGFKRLLDSCEEGTSSTYGTNVRCMYDFHGIRSDEIGLGPYSGNWFDFRIREGQIVSVSGHMDLNEFSPQMWEPFREWVAEAYPEDVAIMYTNSSQTEERLTEESIALWEQRSREYVDVVNSASG